MTARRQKAIGVSLALVLVLVLTVMLTGSVTEAKAPVWCSKLYDPLYPLPYNYSTATGDKIHPQYLEEMVHSVRPPLHMPILQVLPDVQPYTWETSASLLVTVNTSQALNLPSVQFTCWLLAPNNTKLQVVASSSSLKTGWQEEVTLQLQSIPVSINASTLQCTVQNPQGGAQLASVTVPVIRVTRKANEVKINNRNMGLIGADGLPLFGFGFYYDWDDKTAPIVLEEVRNGFNTPLPYRPGSPSPPGYLDLMKAAAQSSVRLHYDMYQLGQEPPSANKTQTILDTVTQMMDQTGLLAYYIADEPDGSGFGLDPSWLREVYLQIKSIDPWHPVTLVLNCANSARRYDQCADVIMVDPYCIDVAQPVGCDDCTGHVYDVSNRVESVVLQINGSRPLWTILQSFTGTEHWPRLPSWQEIRSMTYLATIKGTRSMLYFLEGLPYARSVWAECRRVALEFQVLTPAILSPDGGSPAASLAPSPRSPTVSIVYNGLSAANYSVNATAFIETERGVLTILAANSYNLLSSFILQVDLPSTLSSQSVLYPSSAQVLFENRETPVKWTTSPSSPLKRLEIQVTLNGLGTAAFRLDLLGKLNTSHAINPTNLIVNPSFEQQHNAALPDGFYLYYPSGVQTVNDPATYMMIDTRLASSGYSSLRINVGLPPAKLQSYPVVLTGGVSYTLSFAFQLTPVLNDVFSGGPSAKIILSGCGLRQAMALELSSTVSNSQWTTFKFPVLVSDSQRCSFTMDFESEFVLWIDDFQLYTTSSPSSSRLSNQIRTTL